MTDLAPPNRPQGPVAATVLPFPTNEGLRILVAIREGTLGMNANGRYIIAGQDRPDRATREKLTKRGYIDYRYSFEYGYAFFLTEKGVAALAEVGL